MGKSLKNEIKMAQNPRPVWIFVSKQITPHGLIGNIHFVGYLLYVFHEMPRGLIVLMGHFSALRTTHAHGSSPTRLIGSRFATVAIKLKPRILVLRAS